jgi:hypothetical protein
MAAARRSTLPVLTPAIEMRPVGRRHWCRLIRLGFGIRFCGGQKKVDRDNLPAADPRTGRRPPEGEAPPSPTPPRPFQILKTPPTVARHVDRVLGRQLVHHLPRHARVGKHADLWCGYIQAVAGGWWPSCRAVKEAGKRQLQDGGPWGIEPQQPHPRQAQRHKVRYGGTKKRPRPRSPGP